MLKNTEIQTFFVQKNNTEKIWRDGLMLASPFQDGMVLQRRQSVPVRGRACPLAVVEVCYKNLYRGKSIASGDGTFTVRLPAMEASETGDLVVRCGKETLTLHDVAVGEIYLASGQSNMEFQLGGCKPGMESLVPEDFEGIRYYKIPNSKYYGRQTRLNGNWAVLDEHNAASVSGIAFFFARAVRRETGVPVGILEASEGGINIESFLSRESLLFNPDYREEVLAYDRSVSGELAADPDGRLPDGNRKIMDGIAGLFPEEPDDSAQSAGFEKPEFDDGNWDSMLLPDPWTQAGHNHAGIFWFRKTVDIPEAWSGKDLELHLGAVDKSDRVYWNGELAGHTGHACKFDAWNTLRVYRIPAHLVQSGCCTLAVRAASMVSICFDGGLTGPEEEMYLAPAGEDGKISLAGTWRYRETFDAGTKGMTFMRSLGAGVGESFHMFYDNLFAPLAGFPMRGFLWYQGEANAICMAKTYRKLLETLIDERRRESGNPDLDFFIIQLPEAGTPRHFAPYSQWALLREAQHFAARTAHADCVATIGLGSVTDLHPTDKKSVGEAVARIAAARILQKPVPHAPECISMQKADGKLVLRFSGDGLKAGTEVHGFTLGNAGGQAFAAQACVAGEHTVEVFAPDLADPVHVWYAWADNPGGADFHSVSGVRVSPFRASLSGDESLAVARNLIPVPVKGDLRHGDLRRNG